MMQRRELFSSLASSFKKKKQGSLRDIRPPYYKAKEDFAQCVNCEGNCKDVCDEQIIIIKDDDKSPVIDFGKGGCTYCDKCADVCEFNVLALENKKNINAKITIDMLKCLSWNKTMCFSCKDVCLDDAIEYLGLFRPEIDGKKCTSCGFCVNVCPTNAIKVE